MSSISAAQSSRRVYFLYAALAAVSLIISVRLFYWQIVRHDDLSTRALDQRERTIIQYARRGDIVTSDGVLLATDVYAYEIAAHPPVIQQPQMMASLLAPILNSSESELTRIFRQTDKPTVMLARSAPSSVGPQLDELRSSDTGFHLIGIDYVAKPYRRYPVGSLAPQVIGFVNASRSGAYGVEQYYNTDLAGRNGELHAISDALGEDVVPFDVPTGTQAVNGSTIILTLDSAMQSIAERELARAVKDNGATGGQVIILEAATSKILAMASIPSPDLNNFSSTRLDEYNNPNISLPYEPGSVFKVLTLAAGLDSGRINANSTFNDTGSVVVGGRNFYNHDFLKPGVVNLVDVMKLSLNVEACKINVATGVKNFYSYMQDFGFGTRTGVDLSMEIPGTVKTPGDGQWYESDLCSNAFGQGIAVTPLQMANAIAAVANGGKLLQPYMVQRIVRPDGTEEAISPRVIRQVLKPETARLVTQILSQAIGKESINQAVIPGYSIAGKTGTAQIPIPGGYDPKWTIASFGGYLPAEQPRFVILVKIDRPTKSQWGSVVASPTFAAIARQLLQLIGLPPEIAKSGSN